MKTWRSMFAACALALAACGLPWETASGGSATETTGGAKVTGMVVYPDGAAAAGAYISVRAAAWPGDPSADTGEVIRVLAGRDGAFRIDTLASGEYLIVAGDGKGNLAMAEFRNDAERKTQKLVADTLRPAGGIAGSFARTNLGGMDTGHVEIFGLGRKAQADSSGAFSIEGLPAGKVKVRPRSTRPSYAYSDTVATVLPAATASLAPFTPRLVEDYSTWTHSRIVTVDAKTAGVDSTVRDFPLAVRMTGEIIDLPGQGGRDLRFADAQGRHLAYALQTWAPGDNYAMAWVRLDSIKGGGITNLRMYWGKPDAADQSDAKAVFKGFAGVWHLHDSIAASGEGTFADVSPSAAHAEGKVAGGKGETLYPGGQEFSGTHMIVAPDRSELKPAEGLYVSAWARLDGLDSLGAQLAGYAKSYGLFAAPDGNVKFYLETATGYKDLDAADSARISDGNWHHYAGSWSGGIMRVYFDGDEHMSTAARSPLAYPKADALRIGGMAEPGWNLKGRLAEIMVSPTGRSYHWIRMQYQTQKPNSGVVGFVK